MKKIKVLEKEISLYSQNEEDYICITDIAKYKNSETTGLIISHWLSTRFTVEFMGFWEKIHNPDFNVTEFRNIKNQSGSNGFVLTVKQWVQKTNVIRKKVFSIKSSVTVVWNYSLPPFLKTATISSPM